MSGGQFGREGQVRTEMKPSAISFQPSAGGNQASVVSYQASVFSLRTAEPRREKVVENRLAERTGLWKRPLKAVKFMKISDLTIIRTDFLDQAKKWLLPMAIGYH